VKNIKKKTKAEKTGEELPVEVEHFCSILAKIALRAAGRCEHGDTPELRVQMGPSHRNPIYAKNASCVRLTPLNYLVEAGEGRTPRP